MATDIRSFVLPDTGGETEREKLIHFLRSVEVSRIDTAYAEGGWHILVIYEELRQREESAQIKSAILGALIGWRNGIAATTGSLAEEVLPEELADEIAHYAPTTVHELSVLVQDRGWPTGLHGAEVVQVVRETLEDLIED